MGSCSSHCRNFYIRKLISPRSGLCVGSVADSRLNEGILVLHCDVNDGVGTKTFGKSDRTIRANEIIGAS